MRLETPQKIRDLQRKLYFKAKSEPKFRFYLLADKVWREDILRHAYRLVRANGGAPGIDGETFQSIETGEGEAKFVLALQQELKMRKYLQKRRQTKGFGYRRWPAARLYAELGLYAIPTHAPYRQARMP